MSKRIWHSILPRIILLVILLGVALALSTCMRRPNALAQIRNIGVLRVATINSATTYYLGGSGPKGLEYDLTRGFAKQLGVRLKIIVVPDRDAIIHALDSGRAQLGAGLAISAPRSLQVRFTLPYSDSALQAVYQFKTKPPRKLADLSGRLVLPADMALTQWLREYRPDIKFRTDDAATAQELMAQVAKGEIGATVAPDYLVAMNQRYYPALRVGFTLKYPRRRLGWAFPRHAHHNARLYKKALVYLQHARQNGRIRVLHNRYFGHAAQLGFSGGAEFARQTKKRLKKWEPDFKSTGSKYGIDWRLLAAIGYQESRWDSNAVSPTQVRGIMMLTRNTAKLMGVSDRNNPQQSIDGGARYLLQLRKRLPKAIKQPDRTWFALAAYNLGLGHILDARQLLQETGRNPNVWVNLRDALIWLTEKHYFQKTRHGYANGKRAITYVSNVRAYYDILVWMTSNKKGSKPAVMSAKPSPAGVDQDVDKPDISIISPAF